MRPQFRSLQVEQLERSLKPFLSSREVTRPQKGWIRALRQVSGMTLREFAMRMRSGLPLAAKFEKSEAEYRITLKSLRRAADALGCELVYALVPKQGNIRDLIERRAKQAVTNDVLAVEHTMALENQAVGRVQEKIDDEAKRLLKK